MAGLTGTAAPTPADAGVQGTSVTGNGVEGISNSGTGVSGTSQTGDGVRATSTDGNGLSARSTKSVAIFAESVNGTGIIGIGHSQPGVSGSSDSSDGVRGVSATGNGVSAFGGGSNGVGLFSQASAKRNPAAGTNAIAGFFDGDVVVTGDISLTNADLAEDFSIAPTELAEPGTVMVLDAEGNLQLARRAYEKGVIGVISGAGDYKPGIVLDKQAFQENRRPIALVGKVYCKVDAQYGSIEVGDLLTTSHTPGHAMKAGDPLKAFGSVIGKALRPLNTGQGMIPILVALQ